MRLTKNRKIVLELLKTYRKPLSAELIFHNLPKDTMDLSTIYRSLEALYLNNYILKSTLDKINYYHLNEKKHTHYMMCLNCNKLTPIDCSIHEYIEKLEIKNDLTITNHDLTFYGICQSCKKM